MSEPSPPVFETLLAPYQEHVAMGEPTRFSLVMKDISIYEDQGDFSADDFQVLLKMNQSYEIEQRNVNMLIMRQTAKLVHGAHVDTFAQQTASMLVKLGVAVNQLNEDMLQQALQQLSVHGKQLLLQSMKLLNIEQQPIIHWQQIADEEPQLLYKMYKPIFDHLGSQE